MQPRKPALDDPPRQRLLAYPSGVELPAVHASVLQLRDPRNLSVTGLSDVREPTNMSDDAVSDCYRTFSGRRRTIIAGGGLFVRFRTISLPFPGPAPDAVSCCCVFVCHPGL